MDQSKILTSNQIGRLGKICKQENFYVLRDEIARQTIECGSNNTRDTNLIPLIDPTVQPHVDYYFRGKTRFENARAATLSKTNNQPIINDKCCRTPTATSRCIDPLALA